MTDATILIPTYRHAALLPYAVRSALAQEGATVEVFVVGDGVEEDTRAALGPFLADPRVRFFDLAKGERHGERNRHQALAEATGQIVCYLSDDDLLLGDHVVEMRRLLLDADFAHSATFKVERDGSLVYRPVDLAVPGYRQRLREGAWNAISLTGAAHTLSAYRRLPHGWRPAPAGIPTDLYMWQQFLELPNFSGVSARRLTHLNFPSPQRQHLEVAERVAELEAWSSRFGDDGFRSELDQRVIACAVTAAAVAADEAASRRELLEAVYGSWWWRLGGPLRRASARRSLPPRAR